MRALKKRAKVSVSALVLGFAVAGGAYAEGPAACSTYKPAANSNLLGKSWSLSQRDDGQDWSGPWTLTFAADGKWTQNGKAVGQWCQNGDLIVFGFDDAPHTIYRSQLGRTSASGVESWDGGGTGIFEMVVAK